jgi:hypothetical protein
VFQRHFGTRAVTENLGNGFDWRPVVVQPGTETTAEGVEAAPLDARALQRFLDDLGAGCQVQREGTRTLEDPSRARIRFPMSFQFCNHVRQEMHSGGTVLHLRLGNLSVPHSPHDVQVAVVEVDVLPFQAAKFCQRKTRPRGNHDRTPCRAVHRVCNLLNLLQRVLVGLRGFACLQESRRRPLDWDPVASRFFERA